MKLQAFKETPTQVFSCQICKIFKNTYFKKHLQRAASKWSLKIELSFGKTNFKLHALVSKQFHGNKT